MARGTIFQEIRPGAGFKTGDFVKEKGVGGAAVERLLRVCGRGEGPRTLIVEQLASDMIKKRHAHDSQGAGDGERLGSGTGAGKGGRADRGWMLLSGGACLAPNTLQL